MALYRATTSHWPFQARGPDDLRRRLGESDHLLPLPKEPAALANIIEVSVVDFLVGRVEETPGVEIARGTERGYPDLELQEMAVGD